MLVQIQESLKLLHQFLSGWVKNGHGHLFSSQDPKICCILRNSV